MQPASKRRQLILTDFPRLIEVKDEKDEADKGPKVKFEAVFVKQPTGHADAPSAQGSGGANRVLDVQEKGTKGFIVNTVRSLAVDSASEYELTDRHPLACSTLQIPLKRGTTGCKSFAELSPLRRART